MGLVFLLSHFDHKFKSMANTFETLHILWRFVDCFQVTMSPHILRNPYVTQFCRNKLQKQERQDCQEKEKAAIF